MTSRPTKQNKKNELNELNDEQLDAVSGGTKAVDKSSPNLFAACCNGKHLK